MSSVKLVSGHNGTPVELQNINPPLLAEFAGAEVVLTHWHDYISREQAGDRSWVTIGKPWIEWILFRVSRAELALLMTYVGDVTITCLDQTANQYKTFNASLKPPEVNSQGATWAADAIAGWTDVTLTFYDLVVIP